MSLLSRVRGFIFLFHKSSRPPSIKPLTAYLYKPLKVVIIYIVNPSRYSKGHSSHVKDERAPSTAKEFERVAEAKQKLQEAEQGIASRTSDKFLEAAEEVIVRDANVETVKKRLEQHDAEADYRRREYNKA